MAMERGRRAPVYLQGEATGGIQIAKDTLWSWQSLFSHRHPKHLRVNLHVPHLSLALSRQASWGLEGSILTRPRRFQADPQVLCSISPTQKALAEPAWEWVTWPSSGDSRYVREQRDHDQCCLFSPPQGHRLDSAWDLALSRTQRL